MFIAVVGYLAIPAGLFLGSLMPWVDPETIGPQKLEYYAWSFAVFGLPNVFLTSALLFGLATLTRSMMASYIGAVVLVMAYLITSSIVGQKIEYREAFALWEPLGNGAIGEVTRYWTQSEMNNRLIPFDGVVLLNRLIAIGLGVLALGITLWRFRLSERAPSKRKIRKLAKRQEREARAEAIAPVHGGEAIVARDARTSRWVQFVTRLRIEIRQVLTSPGLIILCLLSVGFTGAFLWLGQSIYGTSDYPTLAATVSAVRGSSTIFLIMIAAFYGGELVWRERDRKLNEIIDSTPVSSWVMTIPKMIAIFVVLLVINLAAMVTGLFYQLVQGAGFLGIPQYSAGSWFRPRLTGCKSRYWRSSCRSSAPTNISVGAFSSSGLSGRSSSTTWAIRTRSTAMGARRACRSATLSGPAASGSARPRCNSIGCASA
jgi:ABC-type transport system involved in multi-copper enzyme maturation permease subunit